MENEREIEELAEAGTSAIHAPFIAAGDLTDTASTPSPSGTEEARHFKGSGPSATAAEWQQLDLSEEDMEESDMDDSMEVPKQAEGVESKRKRGSFISSSAAQEPQSGRRKIYASEEHNLKERIRRKDLKDAVHELRNQLRKPTKKPSTISVLKAAKEEIEDLTCMKERDERRLEELKRRHSYLQYRLEALRSEAGSGKGAFPPPHLTSAHLRLPGGGGRSQSTGITAVPPPAAAAAATATTAMHFPMIGVSSVRPLPPSAPPHAPAPPMAVIVRPGLSPNPLVAPSLPLPPSRVRLSASPTPLLPPAAAATAASASVPAPRLPFMPPMLAAYVNAQGQVLAAPHPGLGGVGPGPLPHHPHPSQLSALHPAAAIGGCHSLGNLANIASSPSSSQRPQPFSPLVSGISSAGKAYPFAPHMPISFRPPIRVPTLPPGVGLPPAHVLPGAGGARVGAGAGGRAVFESWTDNPGNEKPYFPIKVFGRSQSTPPPPPAPPPPHTLPPNGDRRPLTTSPQRPPPLPPPLTSPSPALLSQTDLSPHADLPPHSPPPTAVALPEQTDVQIIELASSQTSQTGISGGSSNHHSGEDENSMSYQPMSPHGDVSDGYEEDDMPSSTVITIPGSEEDSSVERVEPVRRRRPLQGFRQQSSSDSDSGGSCSSGSERRRTRTKRLISATRRGAKSSGGDRNFRNKKGSGRSRLNSRSRHTPPPHLQVARNYKLAGEGGRGFHISMTSNCRVSTGTRLGGLGQNGTQTRSLPLCPGLDKVGDGGGRSSSEGRRPSISRQESTQVVGSTRGYGWSDDIIERTVMDFQSKFPELSEFSGGSRASLKTACVQ